MTRHYWWIFSRFVDEEDNEIAHFIPPGLIAEGWWDFNRYQLSDTLPYKDWVRLFNALV